MNCRKLIIGFSISVTLFWTGCTTLPAPAVAPSAGLSSTQPEAPSSSADLNGMLQRFQKGIELLERNKPDEAMAIFKSLRDENPDVVVFHINLGIAYKKMGRMEEAVQSYQKAIQLEGRHPEASYNLAILFREQGAFHKAEEAYRQAIDLDSRFKEAHYNLAILYDLYLDEPQAAVRHYQKYLDLGGDRSEEIQIWMAALQKRMERQKEIP